MNELVPELVFSYSQFFVYDHAIDTPSCLWTEEHVRQGFARREGTISVGTVLEYGVAKVLVGINEHLEWINYERVIAIPLRITSGRVAIDGPEEYPINRTVAVPSGTYRVIIAQRVISADHEEVVINLETTSSSYTLSEILRADELLDPPAQLLETADEVHI
jgi:hypothetical protein